MSVRNPSRPEDFRDAAPAVHPSRLEQPWSAWTSIPSFVRFAVWVWAWGTVLGFAAGILVVLVVLAHR